MPWLERAAVLTLCGISLTACATSALDLAPSQADRPWAPATDAQGEIVSSRPDHAEAGGGYVLPRNANVPAAQPTAVDPARAYALADLIDLAETINPLTRIAWDDARRAALSAGIAESAYLPKITAIAVAGTQATSGHDSGLGASLNTGGSGDGAVSAISLQWLLFDFGERQAIVEAAKQVSIASDIAFTAAHQQVIHDVTVAYYANAAARTRLATAGQALKNAQAIEAAANDRKAHGLGTIVEVAQARQATAQANLAMVQATGQVDDAYLTLLSAVGVSPLTRIKLADLPHRTLSKALTRPVEEIVATSVSRRPDVLSAYAAMKASKAGIRAAEAEFKPKLYVSGVGSYSTGSFNLPTLPTGGSSATDVNITGNHFGGSILAGVTVPLFDGGTRAAALAKARAEADSADARLDRVRDEAIRQIVGSDNALRTSLSALEAAQSLEAATQTTFDSALVAYRNGVGPVTDVILAQTQLLQAQLAAADAYSTALSAAATLALATGALGAAPD